MHDQLMTARRMLTGLGLTEQAKRSCQCPSAALLKVTGRSDPKTVEQ
jgi:hypothetical protein